MSVPSSQLLAIEAVEALRGSVDVERYPNPLSKGVLPEALEGKLVTAFDMLRDGSQHFLHVGRHPDNSIVVTRGNGELGGGIWRGGHWPLKIDQEEATAPVGIRIKNMTGHVLTANGIVETTFKAEKAAQKNIVLGLGRNIIVDGEYSNDVESALEDLEWLMNPWERVFVVGNAAVNSFLFGLIYSRKHRPEIGRLIFGQLTKEELEHREAARAVPA